ncbi:hypothetical protein ACFP1Z_10360 [Streptomyces gamaensis]|uniref:DNA primase/polymerase bifunctional N-terminal domain-containing protein n=1 Tax=Streptomyces gamaensis TaxID=1763542 RepID=A0ABW0YYS5_9ACTN
MGHTRAGGEGAGEQDKRLRTLAVWLASAAQQPQAVFECWRRGACASLTVGTSWDAVRVEFAFACRALGILKEQRCHIGPHLVGGVDRSIWVLLPLGTAHRLTGLERVAVQETGQQLLAPAPYAYSGDRVWLLPGVRDHDGELSKRLTSTDDLRKALGIALQQRSRVGR